MKPLAIDLFCGLGGWTDGLIVEGYDVVGFDIEQHVYGEHRYPAQLVVQDVRTIHGSQFKNATLIVASPPCQEYSYMAMPWTKAKALAADYRSGKRDVKQLTALFDACFRIQREACEAAGRHIPMVVENVRGAIPWVGRSRWNFGSFHLWGEVPALMPIMFRGRGSKNPSFRFDGSGRSFQSESVNRHCGTKVPGMGAGWRPPGHPDHKPGLAFNPAAQGRKVRERIVHVRDGAPHTKHLTNPDEHRLLLRKDGKPHMHQLLVAREGAKSVGSGPVWWRQGPGGMPSKSSARKFASAMIAKIPLPLSRHIARCYLPAGVRAAA